MIRIDQIKARPSRDDSGLVRAVTKKLGIREGDIEEIGIIRKSLDARKKPDVFSVYSIWISVKNEGRILKKFKNDANVSEFEPHLYESPSFGDTELKHRPLVVGMGPAGLFCAYELARLGYKPLAIERGRCVEERKKDVRKFWETGVLDTASNVQFGEGGAGAFSDGKLTTSVKDKDGRVHKVLKTLVDHGAPDDILYEHMPHLGTDVLPGIVESIRRDIVSLGGEVRFETTLTGIETKGGKIISAKLTDKDGNVSTEPCDVLILAIGHSARDTYKMLYESGLKMEQKPFAAGFRVQHPQEMIDLDRYGSHENAELLGASPYKVTANFEDRGVFSFCMCPGGYVVNSSSEEGMTVVNGMSYSGRDSGTANSAIVVSIPVSSYGSDHPLAGIAFQQEIEKKTHELANGRIPAERYEDFRRSVLGDSYEAGNVPPIGDSLKPMFKGDYKWCDLSGIFDEEINRLFVDGMTVFGRQIKGFDAPDVIMAGTESRTSSPVRIVRSDEMFSETGGIIPIGEGAGYAGGITSAAVDGIRGAEAVIRKYRPLT